MMQTEDGRFGLYKNHDTGIIYFNLRTGDIGAPLNDILPESMQGDGFEQAPIADFLNMNYFWLTTDKTLTDSTKGKPRDADGGVKVAPPAINLSGLKLLKDDGSINYERVVVLCRAIGQHWDKTPQIGLIQKLLGQGDSHEQVADLLGQIAPHIREGENVGKTLDRFAKTQSKDENLRFANIMLPPEYRNGQVASRDEIDQAMDIWARWLRSVPKSSPLFKDQLAARMDLLQLGIRTDKGKLNEKRARLISDYIWSHREDKPSFLKLMKWLRDEVDSQQIKAAEAKQVKATQARKKAKAARKRAKKSRRK